MFAQYVWDYDGAARLHFVISYFTGHINKLKPHCLT